MLLPSVDDRADFAALRADAPTWLPAIEALRQRHDLDEDFAPSATGSVVVFLSPSWCIKLHPPLPNDLESCRLEVAVLRHLASAAEGRLPIPTPTVIASGAIEGWEYFVSTRLPGVAIDDVWSEVSGVERIELAGQLGAGIRAMHELALGPLAEFAHPWQAFVDEQRGRCLDRERDRGLDPALLGELEAYLQGGDGVAAPAFAPSLLHTEIGPGHVLVADGRVTGLIDFGDAMIGDPDYDIAAVGLFVTRGDARAFRAFCDAYGWTDEQLRRPERSRRLLRHALLHRYGTLAWYLDALAPPAAPLVELAQLWFGVSDAGN